MNTKIIITVIGVLGCLVVIIGCSSDDINKVVVYEPPKKIGSLYEGTLSFDKIDRTRPEGVLFCKTRARNTTQVEKLYTASANKSEIMEMIRTRGISSEFQDSWSQKKLLFSFYYYGAYGPPHWFCFIETPDSTMRVPSFLELENGEWRQGTDVAKYPVRIAFFDLCKKHGLYDAKITLDQSHIDAFISDYRGIDEIITTGMAKDPEHYGPVQVLR